MSIIFATVYLFVNKKDLDEEKHKERCGYIYNELNYKSEGRWQLVYPIIYQLRFVAIVLVALYMENPLYQLLTVSLITFIICAILGTKAFASRDLNKTNVASEAAIITITDFFLISSSIALTNEAHDYIGWGINSTLGLIIFVFLVSMIIKTIRQIINRCRLYIIRSNVSWVNKIMKKQVPAKTQNNNENNVNNENILIPVKTKKAQAQPKVEVESNAAEVN